MYGLTPDPAKPPAAAPFTYPTSYLLGCVEKGELLPVVE